MKFGFCVYIKTYSHYYCSSLRLKFLLKFKWCINFTQYWAEVLKKTEKFIEKVDCTIKYTAKAINWNYAAISSRLCDKGQVTLKPRSCYCGYNDKSDKNYTLVTTLNRVDVLYYYLDTIHSHNHDRTLLVKFVWFSINERKRDEKSQIKIQISYLLVQVQIRQWSFLIGFLGRYIL